MRARISLAAAALLLAGCGGGSGGVESAPPPPPAPTPTPTPAPTPTNPTLTDLRHSQTFQNDAANASAVWDLTTSTGISGSAKRSNLVISYDADTKGYSVTLDGRTQTFRQADIQVDDAYEAIFAKSDGATTDYLTLLKTPYSSDAQTRYVRQGYWQRNVVDGSTQTTDFATFTYGLPTAAAAVPRTGTAGFSVDTFGLVSAPGEEPRVFQGLGEFGVDFGAGMFSTHTYLTETELLSGEGVVGGGIEFTGAGHLSSSDGTFSGNALYEGWFGSAGGSLEGRFYGPNAEELGASFYGTNANGMSVVGSFTGQRDNNVQIPNLTLTRMTHEQLFYTQFGDNLVGQMRWQNSETFTFSPPTSDLNGGQFTIADKVASSDPNFTTYRKTLAGTFDAQDVTLRLYKPGPQNTELVLTYASFGHWSTVLHSGVNTYPVDLHFAYGLETPARLLSGKTGRGRYEGVAYGTGSNAEAGVSYDVTGTSRFEVDFGAQSFSGGLNLAGEAAQGGADVDFGSFEFAGQLAGYVADSTANITQNGSAVGRLNFRFYGPDGEEIAGPFSINVPQGSDGERTSIMGVTAAKRR